MDATLWTSLTGFLGPRWIDEFVLRSKSALLNIKPHLSSFWKGGDVAPMLSIVSKCHSRIASLNLGSFSYTNRDFDELLAFEFNSLMELSLLAGQCVWPDVQSELLDPILRNAPLLRHLVLELSNMSHATFKWETATLSQLTIGSSPEGQSCRQCHKPVLRCSSITKDAFTAGDLGIW